MLKLLSIWIPLGGYMRPEQPRFESPLCYQLDKGEQYDSSVFMELYFPPVPNLRLLA